MKNLFIYSALLFSVLLNTCFSQTGWISQFSGTSNVFRGVQFIDSQTGWATGWYGTTVKTTNGGTNWISLNTNTSQSFVSVFFLNSMTGWLAGGNLSSSEGLIKKTTNGGINWFTVHSSSLGLVFRTVFVTENTGYSVTSDGYVMKSTDGGNGWSIIYVNSNNVFTNCAFVDANTGWVIGDNGIIIKTTNGGVSFSSQSGGSGINLEGIHFISANTGFISSNFGNLLKTTNGGVNWVNKLTGTYLWLNSVYFVNNNTGWLTGGDAFFTDKKTRTVSQILKTTDAGETWTLQVSPSQYFLCGVAFANTQTGWAVGANGTIIKTTNSGSVFVQNTSSGIPETFALSQNYPNPFNPYTKICFALPKTGSVKISVYDSQGREVQTLLNEVEQAGSYEITFDASRLSSGIYFYKMKTESFAETKKMILVK